MALFEWTRTGYGRTWDISIGTGTSADLLVKKWPVLDFVKRPVKKDWGVYPRKLTIPIVDYNSSNGYLRDAVFDSELECTLSLDASPIFSGVIYQSDIIKAVGEDQYDTEIIVSDGLQRLRSKDEFSGTYTYEEFLKELLWKAGFELDIHLYTDWEEDNAAAGLVDQHRLTYEGDTYMEVLQNFCKDFGYQVYQENNVWVVRSLAYFAGSSVTRYVISSASPTSSSVTLTQALSGLYKSSDEDIIRGTGKTIVKSSWDILDGEFLNPEFEDDEEGWTVTGTPPSAGTLDNSAQQYNQTLDQLIKSSDVVTVDFTVDLDYSALDTSTTVRYAQVILRDYDGDVYYLQNDGTITTTETTLSKAVETPPIASQPLQITYSQTIISGFVDLHSKIEVVLQFDSDSGNYNSFTFANANLTVERRSIRLNNLTSTATGSAESISEIDLTVLQNNTQYAESNIEYYDGTDWQPALLWDSITGGEKRAKDEVIVRNIDMSMIMGNIDYGSYEGLDKIYTYDSKSYIPLVSTITIGEDDVDLTLVEHQRSVGTITVSDEFSNQ